MDGVHGDENICTMWMHHYNTIIFGLIVSMLNMSNMHSSLVVLLAIMVSAMLIQIYMDTFLHLLPNLWYLPNLKDKNKRISDKCIYRPININILCLSNMLSKVVDNVIMNCIDLFLQTTPAQFGFKPKHGTEMCVFAFKELIQFIM